MQAFSHFPIYLVLDVCLLASEMALAAMRRSSQTSVGAQTADRGSVRLLWIVTVLAVTGGHEIAFRGLGPYLTPAWFWRGGGVVLFSLGLLLRWWAIKHLGRFFTVDVAIARDHRVVDNGPYRHLRHPSYTGLLLEFAGLGLTLRSIPAWLCLMLPIFVVLLYRVRIEEAALSRALGEPYITYMLRTKRLVPGLY